MRKLFAILFIAIVGCSAPVKDGFIVKGTIEGESPEWAFLQIYEDGKMNTVDSALIKNGLFTFTGKVTYPDNYFIQLGENRQRISLFIENSQITILAHADSLNQAVINGSQTQSSYIAYTDSKKKFDDELKIIYQEYKQATDEIIKSQVEATYDSIDALKNEHIKSYVKNNGNSVLAPYIVRRELIYYLDLSELEELTSSINIELKDYKYTKELYEKIETLRALQPGQMAPEFTQNDENGNPVHLSDYRGKYLLIDFWASWCGPCRRANPQVVALYKKYSKKNFDILGVSMDSKKEDWLKAIEDDQLVWQHVSTLEGWKNPVGKLYGVMSIPHAILIDPDGKIVKRGLHVDELETLLAELIK